jgi:pimeloyl-ACP methyl ester carboxylesterase
VRDLRRSIERPDGCQIAFDIEGPAGAPGILVNYPWSPGNAHQMAEAGGLDLACLGTNADHLVNGLAARSRVVVFDYPRGLGGTTGPYADGLTLSTVVGDFLAVADAAGLAEFALLGYSWSASAALEVAARISRCTALVIGGWPPHDPPHRELRDACTALAGNPHDGRSGLAGMYARYYQSILDGGRLAGTEWRADVPSVLFYGTDDTEPMAGAAGSVADLVRRSRHILAAQGWRVVEVPGCDHLGCMSAEVVLPIALQVVSELSSGGRR